MLRNLPSFLTTSFLVLLIAYKLDWKEHLHPFDILSHRQPNNKGMSDQALGSTGRWLQSKFVSLYESAPPVEESDFKTQFSFTFSQNAEIFLNHEKVSVGTFQDGLLTANFALSRASIEWKDMIEVPPKEGETESQGGIVAGSFVVTRSMKFRIRAGPAQRLSYNTFSAKIDQDESAKADDEGSQRRITQLFITTFDKAAPIHFPGVATINPTPQTQAN